MTGLGIHAVVYAAVNALLVVVWIFAGGNPGDIPGYMTHLTAARDAKFWPLYVMIFWGVGLVIHAGVVLITVPARLRQQRARRRARENMHRTVLGILDGTMLEGAALAAIRATDGDQAAKRVKKHVRKARRENERHATRVAISARVGPPSRIDRDAGRPESSDSTRPAGRRRTKRAARERQWVAVMFTDIVESTQLNEALGDDQWARVLADHRSAVRERVAEHGGDEVGTQGDGFLLRFDSPDAAVACATALQKSWSTARVASAAKSSSPVPGVRIGLHAGEVVHDEDDLVGKVINLAARVTDVANVDEILVTEPIADHLTGDIKLVDRGLRSLKGYDRPRHLLAVVWQDSPDVVVLEQTEASHKSGQSGD